MALDGTMTMDGVSLEPPEQPLSGSQNLALSRTVWALIGGSLVVGSVWLNAVGAQLSFGSLTDWLADGGKLAGLCAGFGVILLLWRILEIIAHESKGGQSRMNELVILAVLASILRANNSDDGAIAMQTAGGIAFFMLISLIIESQSAVGAKASLEALARLTPGKARRLRADGTEEMVDPGKLHAGDTIRVLPGENVFGDGTITKGNTSLQEANITGESLPVDKGPGDVVFAGTTNMSGLIEITL